MQPGFPPAVIADARAAVGAYLRAASATDDAVIEAMAASAMALAEAFLGMALIERTHQAVLPVTHAWTLLPVEPVSAITLVEGLPAEGAAFGLPVTDYAIDIDARGQGWVRVTQPGSAGRVRVSFRAGAAADWAGLAAPVAQGIVLLIAHLIDERSASLAPPAAVTALWRPLRRVRLADAAGFRAASGG